MLPTESKAFPLRPIAAGVAVFVALRLLLILSASDQVHPPDWAEVKHMILADQWLEEGTPSLSDVLAWGRDSRNAAHGGFLLVSLLYAVLVVPLQVTQGYFGLKVVALLFAVVGFVGWTGAAFRLGGLAAGSIAGLLFLFPPPTYLAGTSVAWGSHPEAAAILGVAAFLAASPQSDSWRRSLTLGLVLGAAMALSSLAIPIGLALAIGFLWDRGSPQRHTTTAALALGIAIPIVAIGALTGSPAASVTEEADHAPADLLAESLEAPAELVVPSLRNLVPIRAWGPTALGQSLRPPQRQRLDGLLSLALLLALAALLPSLATGAPGRSHRGRVLALCALGPVLHIAVLVFLAPRRPSVDARYLLPLWPCLLLLLSLAVAEVRRRVLTTGRGRGLSLAAAAVVVLWLAPGVEVQATLLDPARIGALERERGFSSYHPGRYVEAEIGHVTYPTAPLVNDFLRERGPLVRGFSLVTRMEAGQDLLLEPPELEHKLDPAAILGRIQKDRATQPSSGVERDRIYENLGWGLAVFAPDRAGLWLGLLSRLGDDRKATARGIGMGLAGQSSRGCQGLASGPPADRAAMGAGAVGRDPSVVQRCGLATPAAPGMDPPETSETRRANPPR